MGEKILKWKVNDAEFKGIVKANLEGIKEHITSLGLKNKEQDQAINDMDKRLVRTEVKSTFWGALAAVIISAASWWMKP